MAKKQVQGWSNRDTALLGSCRVLSDLHHERPPQPVAPVPPGLVPQLGGRDERLLAAGGYDVLEFTAPGDGSYNTSGGFVFGSMAMVGAFAVGNALVNNSRKNRAMADAQPRWMQVGQGQMIVSTHGFYWETPQGLLTWDWDSIIQGEMCGPGEFMMAGQSQHGQVRYIIRSDWSELVFLLWATVRHPQQPQLSNGNWLPPGWPQYAQEMGHQLPPLLH